MAKNNSLGLFKFGISFLLAGAALLGCSHGRVKEPELSEMKGRKVALIEIDGEATAKKIIEVALINQLVERGTFILISKQEVDTARTAASQDPSDWQGIAKRAGAEYALRAKVLEFEGNTRTGYSSEVVDDPQMAEDRGNGDGKTERYYKVKSLTGNVKVQLDFANLDPKNADIRSGIAESQEVATEEAKNSAAHLPPKLRFLEKIANDAFKKFFEKYN